MAKLLDSLMMKLKMCGVQTPFPPYPPCPPPYPPCPPPSGYCPPGYLGPPLPFPFMMGPGFPPGMMMAWLMSWLLYPGMMPYGGGPMSTDAMMRFAATREHFWRSMADAQGEVFQQAANASRFFGYPGGYPQSAWCPPPPSGSCPPPPWCPPPTWCPPPGWCPPSDCDPAAFPFKGATPIDVAKLRTLLSSLSKEDQDRIVWAVQACQQFAKMFEQSRQKSGTSTNG